MGTVAVTATDVSKRFRLYREKHQSLKERLLHAGRNPYEDLWALRHVSFEILEGQTVGILGRNGSGKSTLLKCVSGILTPTEGEVRLRGQLAALLELGAGFQPELSGRENVYMNASLLGLSTREVDKRFDEIVAFAELEQFIDQQVKFYSSGMYVRLGFAVAVNVEPDVLVVDEVLAVGDERFQRKCLGRIRDFQREGRTILFVTHAADLVRQICDRAIVLGTGEMLGEGPPGEAIRLFREHLRTLGEGQEVADPNQRAAAPDPVVRIAAVDVEHPGTGSRPHLLPGEPMTVSIRFQAERPVDDLVFWLTVLSPTGDLVYGVDTQVLDVRFDAPAGPGVCDFRFESVPLLDGAYPVSVGIRSAEGSVVYDEREVRFEVVNPGRVLGSVALPVHADVRAVTLQ